MNSTDQKPVDMTDSPEQIRSRIEQAASRWPVYVTPEHYDPTGLKVYTIGPSVALSAVSVAAVSRLTNGTHPAIRATATLAAASVAARRSRRTFLKKRDKNYHLLGGVMAQAYKEFFNKYDTVADPDLNSGYRTETVTMFRETAGQFRDYIDDTDRDNPESLPPARAWESQKKTLDMVCESLANAARDEKNPPNQNT